MNSLTIGLAYALSFICMMVPQIVFADGGEVETGTKAREHWTYLVSGWRSEREKLRSFDLRIKGHEQRYQGRASGVSGELLDPTTRVDIDLRFVRDQTGSKRKNVIQWGHAVQSEGTWIATKDYVAEFVKTQVPLIDLIKPNDKRQEFAFNFEPEAVGFCGMVDSHKGNYESQIDLVERVVLNDFSLQSLTSLGQGRFKAVLDVGNTNGGYTYREVVTINERKGYSFEDREHYAHYNSQLPGTPNESEIHTEWTQYGDLWLPSKVKEIHRDAHISDEVKFNWVAINTPIPDQEFEFDSMGAPKGTMIVDKRLGRNKSVILGRTGAVQPVTLNRSEPPQSAPAKTPLELSSVTSPLSEPPVRSSSFLIAISGMVLLVISCSAAILAWRRSRN